MTRHPFILLAALCAAVVACSSQANGPTVPGPTTVTFSDGSDVPVTRLRNEPYALTFSSGMTQPGRLVIRDAATWSSAWATIWENHGPTPALPAIDFTREMIVIAALGQRPSGGYNILVSSAAMANGSLVVRIRTSSPGARCGTTGALTQPVDVARLPLVTGAVGFVDEATVRVCE